MGACAPGLWGLRARGLAVAGNVGPGWYSGATLSRARRRVLPLLALAAPFLLLVLGYWPTLAGNSIGLRGPAYWLTVIAPSTAGLSHWERAVGAALPFLAAAAAVGASRLPRALIPVLAVAVLADSLAFAPVAWPRTSYQVDLPAVFSALDRLDSDTPRTPPGGGAAPLRQRSAPVHA